MRGAEFYGIHKQGLRKSRRGKLAIDEQPVVRIDLSQEVVKDPETGQ